MLTDGQRLQNVVTFLASLIASLKIINSNSKMYINFKTFKLNK